MAFGEIKFSTVLFGLAQALRFTARTKPDFAARLKERDLTGQILARDEQIGRWYTLRGGKLTSRRGIHPKPDFTMSFKTAALGVKLLTPPIDWLEQINALKDFKLTMRAKAGTEGKLFGSIGTADISEALKRENFKIQRSEVRLPSGPLRTVGDHVISLHLHADVDVEVPVTIVAEE
jgi:hypothetical protein